MHNVKNWYIIWTVIVVTSSAPWINICIMSKTGTLSGPSCSKLTTSLVNDSLKFTSSDTQIC